MSRPDDDTVTKLLELAGPRPKPPEAVEREVRRAAHAAWRQKIEERARARSRQRWRLAAAAVLAVGIGAALWALLGHDAVPSGVPVVAAVETAHGDVQARTDDGTRSLAPGADIAIGSVVETGARGRAALRLTDGTSVRIDAGSRLRLASTDEMSLDAGAIYLDTGGRVPGIRHPLAVRTDFGVARDLGTQFELRISDESLRVQVREGRVEVDTGAGAHSAAAGVALVVRADGRAQRESIASHGAGWSWVLDASPPFELDGKSLAQYLEWVARETGWRVRYADPELERESDSITLHGTIAGLRPDETPEVVLPGSALSYRLDGGTLVVSR